MYVLVSVAAVVAVAERLEWWRGSLDFRRISALLVLLQPRNSCWNETSSPTLTSLVHWAVQTIWSTATWWVYSTSGEVVRVFGWLPVVVIHCGSDYVRESKLLPWRQRWRSIRSIACGSKAVSPAVIFQTFQFKLELIVFFLKLFFTSFKIVHVLIHVNLLLFQVSELIGFQPPVGPLLLHGDSELGSLCLRVFRLALCLAQSTFVHGLFFVELFLEFGNTSVPLIWDLFYFYLQFLSWILSLYKFSL